MKRLFALFIALIYFGICFSADADVTIHFLDVGDADAIIVLCDGEAMVIDGGYSSHSQFIYSYLRSTLNIDHIKYAIVTHPHDDHIGGIPAVMHACTVEHLLSPVIYYPGEPFETMIETAQTQGLSITTASQGDEFFIGNAKCRIVSPIQTSTNINDLSIVILMKYGSHRFLFTGDIEKNAEEILLNSWEDIHADVLKVAHHGRDTSSSHMFLRVVNADYYIVSGGVMLAKNVRDRMMLSSGEIYTTQEKGTIICHSDGQQLSFEFIGSKSSKNNQKEPATTDQVTLYYIGNTKSKRYHCSWCNSAKTMSEKNQIIFDTKQEALDNGYKGCTICKP